MNGLHIKGMTENKNNALVFTEIGNPVPAVHAFNPDDKIVQVGFDQMQQRFWFGWNLFMQKGFTLLIHDADVQATGMKINATVVAMSAIVKVH
jgi:hypothetical protein|tara:strand:+ start:1417 stop:1695 length:279 start_codon:yes stop_codon:yes gene_type:complete